MTSVPIEEKAVEEAENTDTPMDSTKKVYDNLQKTKAQLFQMMGKALEIKKECDQLRVDNNNLQDYVGSFMSNNK